MDENTHHSTRPDEQKAFERRLRERYRDGYEALDVAWQLAMACRSYLTRLNRSGLLQPVALAIFNRMLTLFEAAMLLLDKGFGMEAGILTRSFLECFVDLRYLTNCNEELREQRARRFFLYQHMIKYRYAEVLKGASISLTNQEQQIATESKEKFKAEFPRGREDTWSGLTLAERIAQSGMPEGLSLPYKIFTGVAHLGPEAWAPRVSEEAGVVGLDFGPSDIFIDDPIYALVVLMMASIEILSDLFDLHDLSERIKQDLEISRSLLDRLKAARATHRGASYK